MSLGYLRRVGTRIRDEGLLKTLEYGALVGADGIGGLVRDAFFDLRYSGRLLHGNEASAFRHSGANDVYHTDYAAMPLIFRQVAVRPEDVLVDVGCGKGRVINYWLSRYPANRMVGLELDPDIAAATAAQFAGRGNVAVLSGDAVDNLPSDGTVFYFYNPFAAEKVTQFEAKLRSSREDKPVRVVYYNPRSLDVFANGRWDIRRVDFERDLWVRRRGRLNKYHDLAIITRR